MSPPYRIGAGIGIDTDIHRLESEQTRSGPFAEDAAAGPPSSKPEDRAVFHGESARTSFIDVWTRRATTTCLVGQLRERPTIVDVGCSAGYLLTELRRALPEADLVGVDVATEALRMARANVPDAELFEADARALPLDAECVDAAVSTNVFEHLANDDLALAEMFRVLRPGARAVIVVPYGAHNYDYFDRYAGHFRRYEKKELAVKAARAGFEVLEDFYLGALVYPAFWAVKQRNRRRYDHLQGDELSARVDRDITSTQHSKIARFTCRLEERLLASGIKVPFGIRGVTVLGRP